MTDNHAVDAAAVAATAFVIAAITAVSLFLLNFANTAPAQPTARHFSPPSCCSDCVLGSHERLPASLPRPPSLAPGLGARARGRTCLADPDIEKGA